MQLFDAIPWLSAQPSATEAVTGAVEETVPSMTVAELLAYAVEHPLVGMLVLVGVLAVIFVVLSVLRGGTSNDGKTTEEESPEPPTSSAPAVPVTAADDGAIVAAITAAITVYLEAEAQTRGTCVPSFHIVSYKRKTSQTKNHR